MVVIVDLEDEIHDPHADPNAGNAFATLKQLTHSLSEKGDKYASSRVIVEQAVVQDDRPNPNVNGFSAALSCYPVVSQLASLLDLNSLHDLSRTCRQFRANLLEYRDQLVKNSLHCAEEWRDAETRREENGNFGRLLSGKVPKCARDMVGDCQRCGKVVCRNCTIKQPRASLLNGRHRRLCRICTEAPIYALMTPPRPRSYSSTTPPSSPKPQHQAPPPPKFTTPAFQRTPCSCPTLAWLCQPCGRKLDTSDAIYIRGWNWRTQYSYYLGGIGTGIGEGNEGVECGRGAACLGAKTVEQELDCDAESLALLEKEADKTGRRWKGTCFLVQEVEGIGGIVKLKVKKRVTVGFVVREHEEERDRAMHRLEREVSGKNRSWCAWCERVIPSTKDLQLDEAKAKAESSSSRMSSGFR